MGRRRQYKAGNRPLSSARLLASTNPTRHQIRENEDPRASPHLRSAAPDRIESLLGLIGRADVARHCPAIRLLALRALKILALRQVGWLDWPEAALGNLMHQNLCPESPALPVPQHRTYACAARSR